MIILNIKKKNFNEVVTQAVKILKNGGVVLAPTETVYALHVDPTNRKAIKKILIIKNRPSTMPLGLIAGSAETLGKYFLFNELEHKVARKFWPGPIGLSLKGQNNPLVRVILKNTLGNEYNKNEPEKNKKAIRVTSNKLLAELSDKLGLPIVSTSANINGLPDCYTVKSVLKQLSQSPIQPDLIIDGGKLPKRQPSTIVDVSQIPYQFLRKGSGYGEVKAFLDSI